MKPLLIMFGGISSEHEVSIITGLQVIENLDTKAYKPYVVYGDKHGGFFLLENVKGRKDFISSNRSLISFGMDSKGGFIRNEGLFGRKIYPYAAYLAFHGAGGESGQMQGLLESVDIPFTSSDQESSVLTMNKWLTKKMVREAGIDIVPGINILSSDIKDNLEFWLEKIVRELDVPVILKPVHLGSSIGIKVAKTKIDIQKFLFEIAFIDREILVEKYLSHFIEYNCAVRRVGGKIEMSEVERPFSSDEILSFADKYERGGKKSSSMASIKRELPAKIDNNLKDRIQDFAKTAFITCRCKGMVRIDFMQADDGKLYLTEINPIPGSMAFYLWEASGVSFKQQISDLVEEAVIDAEYVKSLRLNYKSDIVEKFVNQ